MLRDPRFGEGRASAKKLLSYFGKAVRHVWRIIPGMFARIAVNLPSISDVFDYEIPLEMAGRVGVGQLVRVPFGARQLQGVVFQLVDQPAVAQTRQILEVLDPEAVMTPAQIALAESMAAESLAPLSALLGLFLPPGLGQQADTLFTLVPGKAASFPDAGRVQVRLLALLEGR
jgi:primosomal protein N'